MSDSTPSKIPPPLPDRRKTVGGEINSSGIRNRVVVPQASSSSLNSVASAPSASTTASTSAAASTSTSSSHTDVLGEHYFHLGKHVKEVRRRNVNNTTLIAPKLSDFQEKKGDKIISTKWSEYIEAWIKYIVGSAAYDEIERPLEQFSLNTVKHDLDRLYPMIIPFMEPAKKLRPIYRWENKSLTGSIAMVYLFLWWYDLILVTLLLSMAMGMIWIRFDMFAQYGVDALNEQPETEETVKKWNKGFWMKMRKRMGTPSPYGFNLYDDIDIDLKELRKDLYENYGPIIQLILSDTVDYIERIKNLVTWKRPMKARILLGMITGLSLALTFLPLQYMGKGLFLCVGIEFFVLQPLRSYYPRHRRLFNILNLLLWDIPNDAEYALEVVRLNNTKKTARKTSSTGDLRQGSSSSNEAPLPPRPATLVTKKSATSISDISTNILSNLNPMDDNTKLGARPAASTAATLAMLAAAAAVNKVKELDKNRKEKQKQKKLLEEQRGESSSSVIDTTVNQVEQDNNSDKSSIHSVTKEGKDDPDAFGCMYKGTIPGRITICEDGLIFQTSRMTGSMILVECAYKDIIGVKKTKQYDMLVWHTNGIDISLSDGVVLHFENVIKRDDCFNRLVSASSDEGGGAWRKM